MFKVFDSFGARPYLGLVTEIKEKIKKVNYFDKNLLQFNKLRLQNIEP